MDEFKSALDNLFEINCNNLDDDLIRDYLKKLDSLIKENYSLREKTPDLFFEFVYKILQQELFKLKSVNDNKVEMQTYETRNWNELNLIMNCLKNTAAANKSHLNDKEDLIIKFLIDYLNNQIHMVQIKEESILNFHLNIFKYISNIILGNYFFYSMYVYNINSQLLIKNKGNKKALDKYEQHFLTLSFNQLSLNYFYIKNLDILNVLTMILVLLSKKIEIPKLDFKIYLDLVNQTLNNLIESVQTNENDDEEDIFDFILKNNYLVDKNWPFKLVDFYFNMTLFQDYFLNNNNNDSERFDLAILKLFKYKLMRISHEKDSLSFNFNLDILIFFNNLCDRKMNHFLQNKLQENYAMKKINESEYLDELNNYLNEIKLLANCYSDMLIIKFNEKNDENNTISQILVCVQKISSETLLQKTCHLLNEIHSNNIFESVNHSFKSKKNNSIINLKCVLIRLIGILVYENVENQQKLVEYNSLNIIAANLNVDFDNPFIREWSIISLKHILSCLDLKK
jgi:hypothetical protein